MNLIHTLQIDRLGDFAHLHVREIAYAMATSFVVVVSAPFNSLFGRMAHGWHFLLRTGFYILVFTIGYASLAWGTEHVLRQFLSDQKPVPLLILTICAFVAFGIWTSQRKNVR